MRIHIDKIRESLQKNHSLVVFCECSVRYSGRAESFIDRGERIIMIKKDSSLIVHQPEGNKPVNYMKPGSTHVIDGKNLKSSHESNKEFMEIEFFGIHGILSKNLVDGQSLILSGSEKEMSDMIFNNPDIIEKGFKPVSREEHTKFGFIDVFGFDKLNNLVVVECKRFAAGPDAVQQLRRYVEKIKKAKGIDKVRGILAAPRITSNAEKMLQEWGFEFRAINPVAYHERFKKPQKSLGEFQPTK